MRYVIDFNKINQLVTIPAKTGKLVEKDIVTDSVGSKTITHREYERVETLDGTKYEMINKLLDILLLTEANTKEGLEQMLTESYFGYRLAFETLEDLEIIKYIEDED